MGAKPASSLLTSSRRRIPVRVMDPAVTIDDIELARVEPLRPLPPQPESTAAAPHIKHDATGNLRLTGKPDPPTGIGGPERHDTSCAVWRPTTTATWPDLWPGGISALGDRGCGSYGSRVRAWAGQAEPRDRLTSRDYSPIRAVALSPPKLQMRTVAKQIAASPPSNPLEALVSSVM